MNVLEYVKLIWKNKKSRVGLIILVFYLILAFIFPFFIPPPVVSTINANKIFLPPQPNFYYILGTGPLGESILANIVYGAGFIIELSLLAGLFTTLIGILIGIIAGYLGGIIDNILMAINDIVMTLPTLVVYIILATLIRTSNPVILALILSSMSWTGLARSIRSQVLLLKSMQYIEISKILGLSNLHIIFREIIPNLGSYIAVHFIFNVEGALYAAVGLYFLGVLPVNPNNWGYMISQALNMGAIFGGKGVWYLIFPSLAVIGLMFGLILLSYGIDEITNPRLRA
ncbi:ABC transporter permease [Sulfolobus sp. S-194]|uniref:ABC transporter permease n=1 Tax=Sulfolobus sp. S-194 TaxID=2512240 RepID=UPI001436D73C|nr:ABC transporter permease [Sulfolobus sp. S-194]QIW22720.1 ABC transporter permease [Sulfolobus sp. S-194]